MQTKSNPGGVRTRCRQCGATAHLAAAAPGSMPACGKCGGELALTGKVRLVCSKCHARTKVMAVELGKAVTCPRCRARMQVEGAPEAKAGQPARVNPQADTIRVRPGKDAGLDCEGETMQVAGPGQEDKGKDGVNADLRQSPAGEDDDSLALQPLSADGKAPGSIRRARFGKYEIREEIARGGMGIVYQAYDPRLRRLVALKVLIAGESASEDSIRRFLREARAAGQLKHPHVVAVHEVGEVDGRFYYTMDLVQGRDLGQVADAGEIELEQLLVWLRDVCLALQAAHARGIVHRDLKPQNIMVDAEGKAVIMDFGLAKDLTSDSIQSMTGSVFGTPAYMSPEQARGHVHAIDQRSDIYSMGVILYEAVTGEQPFKGNTVFDTIQAVVNQEPRQPRDLSSRIPADLNTVIMRCLEKDPAARYQSMRELAADLDRFLAGRAVKARPVNPAVLLWRRLRKRPALLGTVAGAPALLLVALLVYALASRDLVGQIRDEIKSGDPRRAHAALTLLGSMLARKQLGKERERGLELARAVIACKAGDRECAQAAARILARVRDRKAIAAMLAYAAERSLPAPARISMLQAAAAIGEQDRPRARAPAAILERLLADEREQIPVRRAAAAALPSFWCKQARLALQRAAATAAAPETVRVAAVQALGTKVSMQSPAMAFLLNLQADENQAVVGAAEVALSRARTRASIFDLYGIRGNVSHALRGVARIESMNAERQRELMALADDPLGERERRQAKQINPARKILPRLEDGEAATRVSAAYDLGVLADPLAISALVRHLADTDASVGRTAARALVKIMAKHPRAGLERERVRKLLAGGAPGTRGAAAYLLGRLEDKASAALLGTALAREKSPRAARAMVDALARIRGRQAFTALKQCLRRHAEEPDTIIACLRALVHFGPEALPAIKSAARSISPRVRKAAAAAAEELAR